MEAFRREEEQMTHKISRRNVLAGGAALLSMSALAPAFAQEARLRVLWWGSQARADRTNKVNQLFQEQTRRRHQWRIPRLERLLATACDPGRRAQCARHHPDGLSLHRRICPARRARAPRRLSRLRAQGRGFRPGADQGRQRRRQALRHQPRRQLGSDDGQCRRFRGSRH